MANASLSMSSATISSWLQLCTTTSSKGRITWSPDSLLLGQQDVRAVELADHLFGIRHEVGRQLAAVELHAVDNLELCFEALGLFDRDDPLVAALEHRVGNHLADLAVVVGRDGAYLGDLDTGRAPLRHRLGVCDERATTAMSIPRFRSIGFIPAAKAFELSRTIAWARTVAVVVPSPA